MSVDTPIAAAGAGVRPAGVALGRRIDGYELALLALICALSLWVVGSDLVQTLISNRVWTHTDGFFSGDQLQYLSWVQSSSQHTLISDMFVLRGTAADYFQPAIILSGLLVRLGVSAWLALMLWKPVAVIGLFLAVRALAHHCFEDTFARRAALTLGLLFGSLSAIYGSLGVVGDMMAMWLSWGYPFALMALALIVFGMLGYAKARDAGRISWWPGLLGCLAGSMHPWQAELMILVVGGAELVRLPQTLRSARADRSAASATGWRVLLRPPLALPALTLILVALPLLYVFALGHLDPVWRMAQHHSKHAYSVSAVVIAIAPLLVFALLGYRGRPRDFLELMLRIWLPAAVILWVLSITALGATPLHAVNGITVPLAMLAVGGIRSTPLRDLPRARLIACAAILIGTAPADIYTLAYAHEYTNPTFGNANFITRGEHRAFAYLASDATPGGVLSGYYLGEALPGLTGRHGFVGDCIWSEPRCYLRGIVAGKLFDGELSAAAARHFVADSGARFLLASCRQHYDVRRQLGAMVSSVRRFGCATVYQLTPPGPAKGQFADVPGRAPADRAWQYL